MCDSSVNYRWSLSAPMRTSMANLTRTDVSFALCPFRTAEWRCRPWLKVTAVLMLAAAGSMPAYGQTIDATLRKQLETIFTMVSDGYGRYEGPDAVKRGATSTRSQIEQSRCSA